jgi:large subunit ribosomal protein L19e
MDLKVQKRLSAQIYGCSPDRVVFDNDRLDDIKQAITKRDLKLLMGDGAITKKPGNFTSKVHARKIAKQKSKGRRSGEGTKKGKSGVRFKPKQTWMRQIRVQREFVRLLLDKNIITRLAYRNLYLKCKGGYFRSRRHIKLFLQEHDELLMDKNAIKKVKEDAPAPKKTRKVLKQNQQ